MGVFYVFKIIEIVPNRAKYLIYFKHERSFREEIVINKQWTSISSTEDLKLKTS